MILAYFILAHLLGDFIFQPTKLVIWKLKSKWGTLVHVVVHFVTTLLILMPYFINGYYWLIYPVLGIAFAHFWIDEVKISYNLTHDKRVTPFIVDQLLHLLAIMIATFFIQDIHISLPDTAFYLAYGDIRIVIFLTALILVSTVIEIFHFQKKSEKEKSAKLIINQDKMLTRVIVLTLLYSLFMILSFYARNGQVAALLFRP